MEKLKVYIAGGMRGDWRQKLYERLKDKFIVIDPLLKEYDSTGVRIVTPYKVFTAWDLWGIRTADIVFTYSEKNNPGVGLIAEAAYGAGLGKTVILVREENNEHIPDRYYSFLDAFAHYVTNDYEDGIKFLLTLSISENHSSHYYDKDRNK